MGDENTNNGTLVVISGPSGVGKSTICRQLVEQLNAFLSVSVTTRPIGENEVDGRDYWFISEQEFETRVRDDGFLEHARVFENSYGTPRQPVQDAVKDGRVVILEVDVQGALSVKKTCRNALLIFILPPSQGDLAGRMKARARGEDTDNERQRLDSASQEIAAAWQHYDHLVINADLGQAVKEIKQIIDQNTGAKQ